MSRLALLAAGVGFVVLLLGVEATAARRPPPPTGSPGRGQAHSKPVLIAGYDSTNSGFNFDGYARGRMLVQVPRGWRLTIVCKNAGSRNHSCAVVHGASTTRLAFAGAAVPNPVRGWHPDILRRSRSGIARAYVRAAVSAAPHQTTESPE